MTLLLAVVAASLAGSLHCVAMCGPLAGMHGRMPRLALAHSLGRLATYVALGALAGGFGGALDLAGDLADVQRVALVASGLVIVAWGLVHLGIALGLGRGRGARGASDAPSSRSAKHPAGGGAFRAGLVRIRSRRPGTRAWLAGVLTGLLPCGWLWAFVVAAAGTGAPVEGAAVMLAFWLGTVPAMVGALALLGPTLGRLRARMPVVTAVALVALGLGTLALRWGDAGTAQVAQPSCHRCGS